MHQHTQNEKKIKKTQQKIITIKYQNNANY